jgi:hypothetical protein
MYKMIAAAVGLLTLGAVVLFTYQYTKSAYYAVGRNNGAIEANAGVFKRLADIGGAIPVCTPEQQREGMGIVTVKAEAIYAIAQGPATVSLCVAS